MYPKYYTPYKKQRYWELATIDYYLMTREGRVSHHRLLAYDRPRPYEGEVDGVTKDSLVKWSSPLNHPRNSDISPT